MIKIREAESNGMDLAVAVAQKPAAQRQSILNSAWKMGTEDPRKIVHCVKVGLALALVSTFYYTRPLYRGLGGTTMWAILTIVVIFEFTVGGTLYKGLNRVMATLSAGMFAVAIHWLSSKSTGTSKTIIIGIAAFLLSAVATYARFIPFMKARFDYGLMIFILTFNFVAISGYRVDTLLELAQQRLTTIAIGISICLLVCIVVRPVWAGEELHLLIVKNMRKLAESIEESVSEYFREEDKGKAIEASIQNSRGYRFVLNSKATEESLANLARWEPMHGRFSYQHPWGHYLNIGTAMRHCAYCIETLNACIHSENGIQREVPDYFKKHLSFACIKLGVESSKVLKELANSIESMKRSSRIEVLVEQMNDAIEEVHHLLTVPLLEVDNPKATVPAVQRAEALPMVAMASLLNKITLGIEGVADMVEDLAQAASFVSFEDSPSMAQNGQEKEFQQV